MTQFKQESKHDSWFPWGKPDRDAIGHLSTKKKKKKKKKIKKELLAVIQWFINFTEFYY